MLSEEFKPGDCVELKSGGPVMTIKLIGDYGNDINVVVCEWFDGTKIKEHSFEKSSLIKIKEI